MALWSTKYKSYKDSSKDAKDKASDSKDKVTSLAGDSASDKIKGAKDKKDSKQAFLKYQCYGTKPGYGPSKETIADEKETEKLEGDGSVNDENIIWKEGDYSTGDWNTKDDSKIPSTGDIDVSSNLVYLQ